MCHVVPSGIFVKLGRSRLEEAEGKNTTQSVEGSVFDYKWDLKMNKFILRF
jgi:hypothetical protein